MVGHKRALGPERRYVRQVLPRAVFAGIRGWVGGKDRAELGRAATIIAVLAATATGYVRGRRLPAAPVPLKPDPVSAEEPWRRSSEPGRRRRHRAPPDTASAPGTT